MRTQMKHLFHVFQRQRFIRLFSSNSKSPNDFYNVFIKANRDFESEKNQSEEIESGSESGSEISEHHAECSSGYFESNLPLYHGAEMVKDIAQTAHLAKLAVTRLRKLTPQKPLFFRIAMQFSCPFFIVHNHKHVSDAAFLSVDFMNFDIPFSGIHFMKAFPNVYQPLTHATGHIHIPFHCLLTLVWPNLHNPMDLPANRQFWEYQWKKHGIHCGLKVDEYFGLATHISLFLPQAFGIPRNQLLTPVDVIECVRSRLDSVQIPDIMFYGRCARPQINCFRLGSSNVLLILEIHFQTDACFTKIVDCTQQFSHYVPVPGDFLILPEFPLCGVVKDVLAENWTDKRVHERLQAAVDKFRFEDWWYERAICSPDSDQFIQMEEVP